METFKLLICPLLHRWINSSQNSWNLCNLVFLVFWFILTCCLIFWCLFDQRAKCQMTEFSDERLHKVALLRRQPPYKASCHQQVMVIGESGLISHGGTISHWFTRCKIAVILHFKATFGQLVIILWPNCSLLCYQRQQFDVSYCNDKEPTISKRGL